MRRPQGAGGDIGAFELIPEWGDPERFTPRRPGVRIGTDGGGAARASGLAVAAEPQHSAKQPRFIDVPATSSGVREIATLDALGLDQGCGGGRFCPEASVTRSQLAVVLARALGDRVGGFTGSRIGFADVPPGDSVAQTAARLVGVGVMDDCGAGLFCPDEEVSRAEAAAVLLRARHGAGWLPPNSTGTFSDVPVADPAAAWIEAAVAEDLVGACKGDRFCPDEPITRAELAVALVRALDLAH